MTLRQEQLEERRQEFLPELAKARQLADTAEAERREMTDAEKAIFDPIIAKGKKLSDDFAKLRHDDAVMQFAKDLANEVGGTGGTQKTGQRLSFKSMGASAASKMLGVDGQKALAPSGAAVLAQSFTSDPIALGRIATGLLDVLPVKVQPTAEYSFLRQTTRTNNAAVVADGAVKPTSVLSVTRIEQSLQALSANLG